MIEESKEKNNQNKKEEGCPLCNVSEDTLKRLRDSRNKETKDKSAKNNGKSRKRK